MRTGNPMATRAVRRAPAASLLLVVALLAPRPAGAAAEAAAPDAAAPGEAERVDTWIGAGLDGWVATYKKLHANPELSLEEVETARHVAASLEADGYEVTTGVGKTGVVGVLRNGEGPTLMIRGDMDALPVREETEVPYASTVEVERPDGTRVGVMHACGHDVHVTVLLAVARLLAEQRAHWRGTVMAVAQPAEELGRGARMMLADGLFERFPKPDAVIALHVDGSLPAGQVAVIAGWAAANVDSVDIHIHGRGGHGARPHDTVDPIVTAAYLVTALQTLVSRRLDPTEPGVVTVGSIHGGSKHNVIPDDVHLQLTVRSYSDAVRETLLDGIRQLTVDTCRSFGCPEPPEVEVKDEYTPAAYNAPELAEKARRLFEEIVGQENVAERRAEMGGEDFGRYARALGVPGLQFRLGSVEQEQWEAAQAPGATPLPSLHSPRYAPDPAPTIRTGIATLGRLALSLLAPAPPSS